MSTDVAPWTLSGHTRRPRPTDAFPISVSVSHFASSSLVVPDHVPWAFANSMTADAKVLDSSTSASRCSRFA